MPEYIEREALLDTICDGCLAKDLQEHYADVQCGDCKDVMHILNAPAADVAPVVHGRWIAPGGWDEQEGKTDVVCSVCKDGYEVLGCYVDTEGSCLFDDYTYCPNCGAYMRGE